MGTPAVKTAAGCEFHSTGKASTYQGMFTVTPGISMVDSLQSASDLLDMIGCPIYAAAMSEQPLQDNPAWLVHHALEPAKAVIDSLIRSIEFPADQISKAVAND
jgi:hypothetical protein